jgi:cell division protein FtsB
MTLQLLPQTQGLPIALRWCNLIMMEESKPKGGAVSRGWVIVAVIAAILILGDLNQRMAEARRLEREARQAQTQVASLEAENDRLRTQMAAATSGVLVEQWARGEAGMVLPGERLLVPVDPGAGTPTPALPGAGDGDLPRPWEVWLTLLFGD